MHRFVILAIFMFSPCWCWAFTGKVVNVADGDTITILTPEKSQVKVRIYGIDTPEKGQAFGSKAADFTKERAALQEVNVQEIDRDRYGRTVGIVKLPSGAILNEEILRSGFAWVYRQYCNQSFCSQWAELERHAQASKIGLWADQNPTPPWEWRHGGAGKTTDATTIVSPKTASFHGNTQSKVFHSPECKHYNCKNCTENFQSREDAVSVGYKACQICWK